VALLFLEPPGYQKVTNPEAHWNEETIMSSLLTSRSVVVHVGNQEGE
jgi:hypothetical protein